MGAVTKLLERFGFVRLRDFGLSLTPDRRIVPLAELEPAPVLEPVFEPPPTPTAADENHWDGEDEWEWEIAVARARAAADDEIATAKVPNVRHPPKLMPLPETLASGSNPALPRTIIPVPMMPAVDPKLVRPAESPRLARASNPPPPPPRRRRAS